MSSVPVLRSGASWRASASVCGAASRSGTPIGRRPVPSRTATCSSVTCRPSADALSAALDCVDKFDDRDPVQAGHQVAVGGRPAAVEDHDQVRQVT